MRARLHAATDDTVLLRRSQLILVETGGDLGLNKVVEARLGGGMRVRASFPLRARSGKDAQRQAGRMVKVVRVAAPVLCWWKLIVMRPVQPVGARSGRLTVKFEKSLNGTTWSAWRFVPQGTHTPQAGDFIETVTLSGRRQYSLVY